MVGAFYSEYMRLRNPSKTLWNVDWDIELMGYFWGHKIACHKNYKLKQNFNGKKTKVEVVIKITKSLPCQVSGNSKHIYWPLLLIMTCPGILYFYSDPSIFSAITFISTK